MRRYAVLNVLKWLAAAVAVMILVFQLYQLFYNPFTTSMAVYFETYDGIDAVAVAVRGEKVMNGGSVQGAKKYVVKEGEKVSKDGVIAEVYKNSDCALAKEKYDLLEAKIERLTEIQSYNDLNAANLSIVESKITAGLVDLLSCDTAQSFAGVDPSEELVYLYDRKKIVTGEETDFKQLIASLLSEKNALEAAYDLKPVASEKSEYSGYFVSSSDGYEEKLSPENLDSLTPEILREVLDNNGADDLGDKIVSEYSWYLAAELTLSESLKLREGSAFTLLTPVKGSYELPVTVHKIIKSEDSSSAIVIFKCNYINGELCRIRTLPVTIVLQKYSGLRIPKESVRIRIDDGQSGVYKISGSAAVFAPINIIHSTDSYVICANETGGKLKLYDQIVVKGKNLYDGKIVG